MIFTLFMPIAGRLHNWLVNYTAGSLTRWLFSWLWGWLTNCMSWPTDLLSSFCDSSLIFLQLILFQFHDLLLWIDRIWFYFLILAFPNQFISFVCRNLLLIVSRQSFFPKSSWGGHHFLYLWFPPHLISYHLLAYLTKWKQHWWVCVCFIDVLYTRSMEKGGRRGGIKASA